MKENNCNNNVVTRIAPLEAQIPNPIADAAKDDTVGTLSNTSITINITTNDALPLNSNPAINIIRSPSNDTTRVEVSRIVHVPNKNYVGQDSFEYDASGGTKRDKATVKVNVTRPGRVLGITDIVRQTKTSTSQMLLRSSGLPGVVG